MRIDWGSMAADCSVFEMLKICSNCLVVFNAAIFLSQLKCSGRGPNWSHKLENQSNLTNWRWYDQGNYIHASQWFQAKFFLPINPFIYFPTSEVPIVLPYQSMIGWDVYLVWFTYSMEAFFAKPVIFGCNSSNTIYKIWTSRHSSKKDLGGSLILTILPQPFNYTIGLTKLSSNVNSGVYGSKVSNRV